MKKIIIILSVLMTINSCQNEKIVIKKVETLNFDFLINKWVRINDKEGSITYENWTKINNNLYKGLGCTLKGKDTVFKETMELKNEKNQWNLIVSGVHEKPISFKLTSFSTTSFVAENPINEFPKIIKYQLKEDLLLAEVIADSIKVKFKFKENIVIENTDFSVFFNRFSKDSIFQIKNIKFPFKNKFAFYENDKDTIVIKITQLNSWKFIDFSEDKEAINKTYDKFIQEFEYVNTIAVIYKRVGIDNGIMMSYYFSKINGKWTLIKIFDEST